MDFKSMISLLLLVAAALTVANPTTRRDASVDVTTVEPTSNIREVVIITRQEHVPEVDGVTELPLEENEVEEVIVEANADVDVVEAPEVEMMETAAALVFVPKYLYRNHHKHYHRNHHDGQNRREICPCRRS